MEYPKKVMRKSELMKMGFPGEFLMYVFRFKGQQVAWKLNPTKSNSVIVFDTDALDRFRLQLIKSQNIS